MAKNPRVGVTFGVNGNDEGHEFESIPLAALEVAKWITDLSVGNVGDDVRIYIEVMHPDE